MPLDPLSPIAPARIRGLILPVGKIKRSRFLTLVERLQAHNVVRLGDVSPEGRLSGSSFFPLSFPGGMVLYDLDISLPSSSESQLESFPFEAWREPFIIIAVADGLELPSNKGESPGPAYDSPQNVKHLQQELESLKEDYPRSLFQHMLIFDHEEVSKLANGPDSVTWIPNPQASRSTTMKTVMCDLTAALFLEMSAFVEHVQQLLVIESPKKVHLSVQQRMTMPAQLPSAPSPSPSVTSSVRSRELASTFDDITRSMQTEARVAEKETTPKSPSWTGFGRDRMSVTGSPVPERMRSRVKGRQLVVVGSLYMQAGRWPDAIKEFVEAITIARSNSDYIWHGKALECILLCFLMLGWAGMDFQIPSNFYPFAEKPSSKSILSSQSTSSSSAIDIASSADRDTSLQHLVNILPDISNYILNLYHRSSIISDEPLPQLIYSETVLRLSRLLTTVSLCQGKLDDLALKSIVLNEPLAPADKLGSLWSFHRNDIASFLMRALPPPSGVDTPLTDSITILAGISSVLGTLRLERKRAFVLREFFAVLVPGLVQARKAGAAAMGIHPAAGLPVLNSTPFDLNALDLGNGNVEGNIRSLLGSLAGIYGVTGFNTSAGSQEGKDEKQAESDSIEAIVTRTLRHVHLKSFGGYALKVEILKACINFCEALPDFQGVVEFTIELLQTVRGTLMLDWDGYSIIPNSPRDEQLRLFANIQRTVAAATKLGSLHLEAEYWDDFLIRGIELANASSSKELARRSKVEFGVPTETAETIGAEKGPFIYNPFAKISETRLPENVLIAQEAASFKITLQNPFEFDVEVEDLRLDATGALVEGSTGPFVLQAFAIQEKSIVVTVASEGKLCITGCIVKVKYCRKRRFPIFHKTWHLDIAPKAKRAGLDARELILPEKRPTSVSKAPTPATTSKNAKKIGPEPDTLDIQIIQPQPTLTVKATSFSQSAIMMLEGEKKSFTISLENISSCPVDFLFFTFEDSTARELQSILNNRDLPAADLYEIELQLSSRPALRWRREPNEPENISIAPGTTATFTIDVLGKASLSDAVVRIDYGSSGVAIRDMPDTFYSRRISIPITITVNAAVEISRCDILPFNGDLKWHLPKDADEGMTEIDGPIMSTDFWHILTKPTRLQRENLCLLSLDIRNSWPSPLSICLNISDKTKEPSTNMSLAAEIRPGHSTRFIAAIPQIYIENPLRSIPRFAGIDNRQFVVSTRPLSYDAEVFGRETFWYREEILKMLSCTWRQLDGDRKGEVDMRNLRLGARAIDALRIEDVEMSFSLRPFRASGFETSSPQKTSEDDTSVIQTGPSKFSAPIDTFLTLHIHIVNNHSSQAIHPLIRLQPSVRNQHHTQALDLSRRLAWTGMLQKPLPPLAPQSTTTVALGFTALSRGDYEIAASLEEIRILPAAADEKVEHEQKKEMTMLSDSLIASAGGALRPRRIWHSRVPCRLFARANDNTQDCYNDDDDDHDDDKNDE